MRVLHVTSPMLRGEDVLALQRRLAELGYHPGRLDGIYGTATASALAEFQSRVDPRAELARPGTLTEALVKRLVAAERAPDQVPSEIGLRALAEAERHVGTKEDPPFSNRTPFGEWFGVDGVKWCGIFVSYCFAVGANRVLCEGSRGAGVRAGRGCAYVPTIEAWLRSAGYWVGRRQPRPGDVAIFNWGDEDGRPRHVGIVKKWVGGSREMFNTVEGNTSVGNDSDGGEVMERDRKLADVAGFGRLA